MEKSAVAVIIVFMLLFSASTMIFTISLAKANPIYIVSDIPRIKLLSPQIMLYYESTVNLSFFGKPVDWGTVDYSKITYWLDGEQKGSLMHTLKANETYSVNLTGLKDGHHTLEVKATVTVKSLRSLLGDGRTTAIVPWGTFCTNLFRKSKFHNRHCCSKFFIVTTQHAFEKADVPLNFTLSESVSQLSYSIDEGKNVTFNGDVIVAQIYGKTTTTLLLVV